MAAPRSWTVEDDIIDAKRAVGLARRDMDELERQAQTYFGGDELNFDNSFRYAMMKGKEKLVKAERKLARLQKRKPNPMPKRKATAVQLRNLAKGRAKLKAMRRAGTVTRKKSTRAMRPRRRKNPEHLSHEAYELVLWVENSQAIQNQRNSVLKNIARKINSGIYDPAKAPVLWKYLMDSAAKDYTKEFGTGGGFGVFTPAIRREAAAWYAPHEYDTIILGEYEYITGPVSTGSKKKTKKRRAVKPVNVPKAFTPKKRNPAYGNFMTARNVLRTGRTTNPARKSGPGYKGFVVAAFKPGTQRVEWWNGKSWGTHAGAATYMSKLNAEYAARNHCNRYDCAVTSVNKAGADIRTAILASTGAKPQSSPRSEV
jgi:hypothetical protein